MTVTHYSLLNQIFYPYKKFDDVESISSLEPWMFFTLSCNENVKIEMVPCESEPPGTQSIIPVTKFNESAIRENSFQPIQQYPPGTQEKYNSFHPRITERRGGVWNAGFPMKGSGRVPPSDTLFWAAYTVFHGEAGYWVIGNKYKNTEIAEKQKIIDSIRTTGFLKRAYSKISNVRVQEIMSELMLDKKTSWNTFMAICAFYKFRALVIRGKTYMEFSPNADDLMGIYLFYKNEDGHISVDLTAIGADKEAEIRNSHLKIDCDEAKPLKAASNYKMEELNEMARILGLEMESGVKVKKADLYDKILEKCIR
jgi:hypothetical protein